MKRFGSISPFLEQGQAERRIGRLVANHDFIKALLRYGSFDQYVLANPSAGNHRDLIAAFDTWGLDAPSRARVRGIPLVDLPGILARERFHVFHVGGWGAFMPGLHHLRVRHACHPWPITGMIFSIHGRDIFDYAVRLAHAELCPYDAVSCLSRDGRDAFAKLLDIAATVAGRRFAGRLEPLPLGLDDDVVDTKGDREAARRRLKIAPEAVVLLVLGRITPSQKMDLAPLFKAFARDVLPNARTPIVLVVAGGASDAEARLLNDLIAAYGVGEQTRVHANFLGRVKPDLLACADMLVAVTDNTQETFGLSLLEAQSAGLPVVASRFDGYKDLVADGVDGFLIDTWWCADDPLAEVIEVMDPNIAQLVQAQSVAIDMTQLADRVLTLAHDAALRARMGEAGRRKVDREYRFSAVIRRYEAWWDALAREAAAAPPPVVHDRPYARSPHEIFAAYPTRTLGPDDTVVAAPGVPLDASYVELRPLLDPQVLTAMLAAAEQPTSIASLVALASEPARGWFTVMWLLKYGILQRVS
jgi:glycosyltransferase involved in cell wall biosynthesis